MKRAAYFLLTNHLINSPPNEAICSILFEQDYEVDIYTPGTLEGLFDYDGKVALNSVAYGKKWLLKNSFSRKWRRYDLFVCTSEDPVAMAGILAWIYRKPLIFLSDEIRAGSYRGDSSELWKKLCFWAMKKADLTIVNDDSRIKLQREYGKLKDDAPVCVYPGCFRHPPNASNYHLTRQRWGMKGDQLLMACSGGFNLSCGLDWVFNALNKLDYTGLIVQPTQVDDLHRLLLSQHQNIDRIYVEEKRLTWFDSWSLMACVDIGIAIYLNAAPQFQHMGTSSNRLCMFLAMGVPVIASKQKSFEFIREYDCGVLVANEEEFIAAVEYMKTNLTEMKENAKRCAKEYINTEQAYETLYGKIKNLESSN